jgi:hypothetical protein
MCAVDDCEPWQVYNDTRPVARKRHCCSECGRDVAVGETYLRIQGLCDDRWDTHKICRHCEALSAFMIVLCSGYPLGDLYGELVEHWREGYASIPLGRLMVAMKHRWHDGRDPVPTGVSELAKAMLQKAVA